MQTSMQPGFSVLEIYWGYEQSNEVPWVHYMRINNLDDGYAILGDFGTKVVWTKPLTSTQATDIINSGTIPDWETVR
jgi:hypothetical protein